MKSKEKKVYDAIEYLERYDGNIYCHHNNTRENTREDSYVKLKTSKSKNPDIHVCYNLVNTSFDESNSIIIKTNDENIMYNFIGLTEVDLFATRQLLSTLTHNNIWSV